MSRYNIRPGDLLSDDVGSLIADEMGKHNSSTDMRSSAFKRETRDPFNLTMFSLSQLVQGVPAYDSMSDTLERFEMLMSGSLGSFMGEVKGLPIIEHLMPRDLSARHAEHGADARPDAYERTNPSGATSDSEGDSSGSDRNAPVQARELISVARGEVGTKEHPPRSNRQPYAALAGHSNGSLWCNTFVAAMFAKVGMDKDKKRNSSYTETTRTNYRSANLWGSSPKVGAVTFFMFDNSSGRGRSAGRTVNHVGICVDWTSSQITTIDGNTSSGNGSESNGGMVAERTRNRNVVVGFGYPEFADDEDDEEESARSGLNSPNAY